MLSSRKQDLLRARFGLSGDRPLTLAEIAGRFGGTAGSLAREIAAAERELRSG